MHSFLHWFGQMPGACLRDHFKKGGKREREREKKKLTTHSQFNTNMKISAGVVSNTVNSQFSMQMQVCGCVACMEVWFKMSLTYINGAHVHVIFVYISAMEKVWLEKVWLLQQNTSGYPGYRLSHHNTFHNICRILRENGSFPWVIAQCGKPQFGSTVLEAVQWRTCTSVQSIFMRMCTALTQVWGIFICIISKVHKNRNLYWDNILATYNSVNGCNHDYKFWHSVHK